MDELNYENERKFLVVVPPVGAGVEAAPETEVDAAAEAGTKTLW